VSLHELCEPLFQLGLCDSHQFSFCDVSVIYIQEVEATDDKVNTFTIAIETSSASSPISAVVA
jgi:hypothetical protein